MTQITVNLAARSYPIYIGDGIAAEFCAYYKNNFGNRTCALVTNDTIAEIYAQYIDTLKENLNCAVHIVKDGEKYKTVDTWNGILNTLLSARLDRQSVVIAFGGGVVGDMAGFAAACFMRGIDYVQIPTTLLAMVDSSVGGKTAVDHPLGKNLIGAFHQPATVWIDTNFLKTLPRREFVAGYAEAFKYAFLGGREIFDFMLTNKENILRGEKLQLLDCINRSIKIKADIVSRDERESGCRAFLNFGHTFAHALEQFYGFDGILHGEAVLWGMVCAVELAKDTGILPREHWGAFAQILEDLPLPPLPAPPRADEIYAAMFADKKGFGGKLRFILPFEPGAVQVWDGASEEAVVSVLKKKIFFV